MDFPPPPEGATPISDVGPSLPSSQIPPPSVTSDIPPPPQGAMALDSPAPPQGAVALSDTVPQPDPPEKTNDQTPGFWAATGSAFGRGFTQNVADAVAGGKAVLPAGFGGQSLEEQFQQGKLAPETKDEIDKLLAKGIYSGWTDPKWWGAGIAHGVGGMLPALGAGVVGAVGGPPGAVGGFVGETALSSLVPAYKAAREKGLEPDEAMTRALIDTGIAGAGAAAMGVAPQFAIFGRTVAPASQAAAELVAGAFKRPALEAIAQLGMVQPLIGDTQHIVTSLTHGEVPGTEDLLTNHALGVGMGVVPVGGHALLRQAARLRPEIVTPPATPEQVAESFKNQQTTPGPIAAADVPPPPPGAEPTLSALETDIASPESRIFFSPLLKAAKERLPDNASVEQVISTLKNTPGVKEEEMLDIGLPQYLAGIDGKVNKADLIAHLESNAIVLEEVEARAPKVNPFLKEIEQEAVSRYGEQIANWPPEYQRAYATEKNKETWDNTQYRGVEYPGQILPGESSNYREFVLKVPPRGELQEFRALDGTPLGWDVIAGKNSGKDYTNSHWPEDINPIAHFRVTDRVDRAGRNLLHVEEIQSDVHQEGRKVGYKEPGARSLEELQKERRDLNRESDTLIENHPEIRNMSSDDWARAAEQGTLHPEVKDYVDRRTQHSKDYEIAARNDGKIPDLPFKTSWQELVVKRILRLAADEGYDGVSWSNGEQIGLRLGTERQLRGAKESYDKILPKLFKKWGDKLGAQVGETKLYDQSAPSFRPAHEMRMHQLGLDPYKISDRNFFLEINPAFGSRVRMGLPLYDEGVKGKHTLSEAFIKGTPKELAAPGKKIIAAIGALGNDIKLSRPMSMVVRPSAATWRGKARLRNGKYEIEINTRLLRSPEDLYATAGHELGHIIYWDKFAHAPEEIRQQVFENFRKFKLEMSQTAQTVGDVRRVRDNAVSEVTGGRNPAINSTQKANDIALSDLTPKSRTYLLHFEEWFAEQVSKWATTSEKPLSRLDKFYAELGKTVRNILERFSVLAKRPATAEKVMQGWLDSLVTDLEPFAADIKDKMDLDTTRRNADALSRDGTPEVPSTPAGASTLSGRNILRNLPPGDIGTAGPAMAAHADRMNKFYEWMTSLPQIAELNKHIRPLTMYKEIVSLMNLEKNNIMGAAWETLRKWKAIRDPKQQIALGQFIDDYMNGFFKDPSDMSGDVRRPTKNEFAKLVEKHKLGAQSLDVFNQLVRDFDGTLETYRQLLLEDASRIKDPDSQRKAMESANRQIDALLSRPFFPAMRFGKYTITVYDSAGNLRHSERTNSLKKQKKIAEALGKSTDILPGDRVRTGEVPKDAAPLLGMPPGLLDLMADKLELSTTQRASLDQLRFDYAPSQSFRHQFKSKDLTPGYSSDFQRAYANFFFHGANHITRVKWVDSLRDQIREVKTSSVDMNDAVKRDQIANYMTEHLKMLVDPKPDFAALRGLMFHWYLGFNPASATLNLSQTALMTFPHLASKFGGTGVGDLRAVGAILRASSELSNFYKKGTLVDLGKSVNGVSATSKQRALAEAVKEGVISETQAHTLAAVSEDRNLLKAFGTKGEAAWQKFSEASSWMFEMTEQYNRRVAFRATWDLAMRDPNNAYVAETVRDNPLQYDRLRKQDWTHQEAAAFTAAKHATEATQFVYAPYSRPKFMWGRKGALFIFKSFTQNTLFNLYNNPAGAARTLLILGAVGGLMGLPGMEDVNGILKSLAWRLFGKDFDLEDEARKFAVDVLHGTIGPDMLLHGTSVKGFGIPAVLNALGSQVGLPKYPTFDRHGSIGMGNILPFEPGKLFGPSKDSRTNELAQVQRASGAGFSLGFALYNSVTSTQDPKDFRRWEGIMPRALSNLSHAWRYTTEGQERSRAGNAIVRFDPTDTEQLGEILGRAAGYQPRRLIAQYEKIQAQQEAATYWDLRKGILLRQFATALKGGNPDEKASVISAIKNYNNELPEEAKAKAITSQVIKESITNRLRTQSKLEQGLPTSKQNYGLFKEMEKYYPEGAPPGLVGVKSVK